MGRCFSAIREGKRRERLMAKVVFVCIIWRERERGERGGVNRVKSLSERGEMEYIYI